MSVFTIAAGHRLLLMQMNVAWDDCEFGAPCICPKKPYGNGDVVGDMAKILGIEPVPTDDEETHWPPGTTERMEALHREMETVLQIVVTTGQSEVGRYHADKYQNNWTRLDGAEA